MFNLALIPIILMISIILIIVVGYIAYRKVKRGIEFTVKKSSEFATDQQQKWETKEKQKKQPELLLKGLSTHESIVNNIKHLPNEWKVLEPLSIVAKNILDEIADEAALISSEASNANTSKVNTPKKLNSIRPFFNHSLDSLLQFTQKIRTDYKTMDNDDNEKARQNFTIIKADLLKHQKTLHKARKMDFDVVMDVIKARLRK